HGEKAKRYARPVTPSCVSRSTRTSAACPRAPLAEIGGRRNGTSTGRLRMFRTVSFVALTGHSSRCARRAPRMAAPPRAATRAPTGGLPKLLVRELDDQLQRAIRGGRPGLAHDEALSLAVEQLEIDHPARLSVRGHEAIEMRPRVGDVLGA